MNRLIKYWLPILLWMLVIFGASTNLGSPKNTSRFVRPFLLWLNPHMSEAAIAQVHYCVRKTAHFVEYFILGILIMRWVLADISFAGWKPARQIVFAILFAALYASSDEWHQKFVPTREPSVMDVALDTGGASFGLALFWFVRRPKQS